MKLTSNGSTDNASADGLFCVALHHLNAAPCAAQLITDYQQQGASGLHNRACDCAAVLFDEKKRTLLLARDRLGLTPFYYAADPDAFAFGTRTADVLNALNHDVAPNRRALAALLVDHTAPARGETYFRGVSTVPPGTTLIRLGNQSAILPAPDLWKGAAPVPLRYQDAVAEFAEKFHAAVVSRVDTAGRTAVLVSGGLDSSAILCTAATAGAVVGINYTAQDAGADESRYVNTLRSAGLLIKDVPFYPTIDLGAIEQAARDSEHPIIDQFPLTLQRAARAAREAGAQTLLLGTWGDQVLAPFPPLYVTRFAPWRFRKHRGLAHAFHQYMLDVPAREIQRSFLRQAAGRRVPAMIRKLRRNQQRRRSMFDSLARDYPAAQTPRSARTYSEALHHNVLAPAQTEAIAGTTQWGLVNQVDVRLPFLDVGLLRFLNAMPEVFIYHGDRLKPLLRDALNDVVPAVILNRRDKGDYTAAIRSAGPPVAASLGQLDGLRRLVRHGLITPQSAQKTLARLSRQSDIATASDDLILLLGVDAWLRIFF
jgi:asparagine synthase (glutamine-hydrolysing)